MKKILIFITAILMYLATLYVAARPIQDLQEFRTKLGQHANVQVYKILKIIN